MLASVAFAQDPAATYPSRPIRIVVGFTPGGDGEWTPIELAGRFMGGTNALYALGVPVAGIVLQRFIAGFDVPSVAAPRHDVRAVKQASTYLVRDGDVATLRDSGVWHAPP